MTRMPARLAIFLLPAMFVASTGCDIAIADYKEQQTSQWTKSYELTPGGQFELSNINGRISVLPSSGNTVEVVAEKSAKAASVDAARQALERIEIQEDVSAGSVRLTTRMQKGSGIFGNSNAQVRYTVKVPAGTSVTLSTTNGGIEVEGMTGRVNLTTTNGGIKARNLSGQVEATTTNGGVDVELDRVSQEGVKLGCTNGGIVLRLPSDAKADISARITNGGIDASGLSIATSGESSKRRLVGQLNGGGPRIELEGTNGGIRLSAR